MKYSNIERTSFIVDQLEVKLEVEFGLIKDEHNEKDLKKSVAVGKGVKLSCPISGHPIKYFWKEIKNNNVSEEIVGLKEFQVPKSLAAGVFNYECRAEISSAVSDTNVDPIKFQVTVGGTSKSIFNQYNIDMLRNYKP